MLSGAEIHSPVVIFDDDPYVMGGALAEMLATQGHEVTLVTPSPQVSAWSQYTIDQSLIHRRLVSVGVDVVLNHNLQLIGNGSVELAGMFGELPTDREAATVVLVTMRTANDALVNELQELRASHHAPGIKSLAAVGDCLAPGLVAEAVFSGHRAAFELDGPDVIDQPFRIEQVPATFEPPLPWADD